MPKDGTAEGANAKRAPDRFSLRQKGTIQSFRGNQSKEYIYMKIHGRGTSFRSAMVLIAIVLASMTLAGGSAALAGSGDKKPVFVSGNSTYSDCGLPASDYGLSMTGDLKGCLSGFIQGYRCKKLRDFDLYFEKGREVFVGKFHGKHGRFRTTYTFAGAYAKGFCQSFDPTLEVGGGCTHPIKGVRGVFADAKGSIKFIDVIAGVTGDSTTGEFHAGTGGNNFLYYGKIDFDHNG